MARPRRPALHPRLAEFRARSGLTQEQVAETVGITAEMVRRHEKGLSRPIELYRQRYSSLYRASEAELGLAAGSIAPLAEAPVDLDRIDEEILGSDTTDEAVERLHRAADAMAEAHTRAPAKRILTEVLRLHGMARKLLQGRQRLSQRRELFRVEAAVLSHACLLLGDVKKNDAAEKCGLVALKFADEAGSSPAMARSALAKTLRWAERLAESADMARLGYASSPATPIRIQLASQEANAAAILGDTGRAHEARRRAERTAHDVDPHPGTSVWSFPAGRRAIFALSVATYAGDPDAALSAAAAADAGWAAGEPRTAATWAQIRVGAGIAHLMKGSLDGAVEEVTPVLDLAPDLRVSTVTGYMDNLDARLRNPRLRGNRAASGLREQIRVFNEQALPTDAG